MPSELHLDVSYQHIIQSTIRKWLIDSQSELEEKQRLLSIIDLKVEIEFNLADIRQEPGKYEVAKEVLQCNDLTNCRYGTIKVNLSPSLWRYLTFDSLSLDAWRRASRA